jgi:hypothetical protein
MKQGLIFVLCFALGAILSGSAILAIGAYSDQLAGWILGNAVIATMVSTALAVIHIRSRKEAENDNH